MKKLALKARIEKIFNKSKDRYDIRYFEGWCGLVTRAVSIHEKSSPHWEKLVEKEMMVELSAGNLNQDKCCVDFDDVLKRLQISIVHEV